MAQFNVPFKRRASYRLHHKEKGSKLLIQSFSILTWNYMTATRRCVLATGTDWKHKALTYIYMEKRRVDNFMKPPTLSLILVTPLTLLLTISQYISKPSSANADHVTHSVTLSLVNHGITNLGWPLGQRPGVYTVPTDVLSAGVYRLWSDGKIWWPERKCVILNQAVRRSLSRVQCRWLFPHFESFILCKLLLVVTFTENSADITTVLSSERW